MSRRLSFHEPQQNIAWQKQLRDQYVSEGAPPVDLDIKTAIVRPVGRHLAEQIILKYEWLGTMSLTRWHYGIFFGSYCAGVTCVGGSDVTGGVNNHLFYRVDRRELLILARGACVHWAPPGTNSKLVSWTCRMVAKASHAKVIIAYADTDAGEIGTIYQACNWIYIGRGSSTRQWIAPNGRVYDQKYPSNLRTRDGKKLPRQLYVQEMKRLGWREQESNPKHRYAFILDRSDKALADHMAALRQPYPKRGRGETDNAPHSNEELGGASPTRPLQVV